MPRFPKGDEERALHDAGHARVAGVDEVGVGAIAGPVVAAAVLLPLGHGLAVRDSKTLSERQREALYDEIVEGAVLWAVETIDADRVDAMGIRGATYAAMRAAVAKLPALDWVLVDGYRIPGLSVPQTAIIKGDTKEFCIAAASIIAKVTRDRYMRQMNTVYSGYFFNENKGYGTAAHLEAVISQGRTPIHRKTFHFGPHAVTEERT
ncbi:ribonuclease HII [Candidatus Uhrbacteria bacterium]|nr:ribonuclease HII [Candidatus Uhrbacteria bacterium]